MKDRNNQDVLIVGAGPVGLVAACELARQGVRARLVDALDEPTDQARAIVVQPRSQDMLATLGALPQMLETALPQAHLEIDTRDGDKLRRLARIDLGDLPTRHPAVLNLPQTETEAALRARAADLDVTIERGVALIGLSQDADGVDVTLRSASGDEDARFGWVIGADGGHSTVRGAAGATLQGSFTGSHFMLADVVAVTDMPRDVTRLFAGAGGLTVVLPMAAGRTRLMFQIPDPGPDAAAGPSAVQVQQLVQERLGGLLTFHDLRFPTYYSVHHAIVPNYRVGRVFLAGDAAHIHSPAAGQGMNTGMQDAANLAWKLAMVVRGRAEEELLDSYHAERHSVGAKVVHETKLMADNMTRTGLAGTVRNAAIAAAGHVHRFTDTLASVFSELSVAYPKSPIVARRGHHAHGALRAGEHGPDVAGLTTPDGRATWIGDLLARPGHLLLARTDDAAVIDRLRWVMGDLGTVVPVIRSAEDAPADAIVDTAGEVGRQYGIGDDGIALIRPDGYVGFLATPADDTALRTYLTETLLVTPTAVAQA